MNQSLFMILLLILVSGCDQRPSFLEHTDKPRKSQDNEFSQPEKSLDQEQADVSQNPQSPDSERAAQPKAQPVKTEIVPGTFSLVFKFPADSTDAGTVDVDLLQPYLYQQIVLKRNREQRSNSYTQSTRTLVKDQYQQGYLGDMINESFIQTANKALDILVVIDTSQSMKEEQVNLSTKLSPLLSYISDTDWRIAVVTTDPNDNCRDLIIKGEANIEQRFANAIQAGINGSNNERGILTATDGLKNSCKTINWVRSPSTIAVLILSDEDNCSDGNDCPGRDYQNQSYLYNYLNSIRVPGVTARVYGIFWHPSYGSNMCSTAKHKANIYSQIVANTKGTWGSICDADYSHTLNAISHNIAEILQKTFTLKNVPDSGSLKVYVNNTLINSGYSVFDNVIEFEIPPATGAEINFIYRFNGVPIVNSFKLTKKPYQNDLTVSVDGIVSTQDTYMHDSTNNQIIFVNTPLEKSEIKISYKEDVVMHKEFSTAGLIDENTLTVKVNNSAASDFVYDVNTNKVVFNDYPPEGAMISLDFISIGSPILSYPFITADGIEPKDLAVYDSVTKESILFAYLFGYINITSFQFSENRPITIRYYNQARSNFSAILPAEPIANTVTAEANGVKCGEQFVNVKGTRVEFHDCDFGAAVEKVHINYDYVMTRYTAFMVSSDMLPDAYREQEWLVYIDDMPANNFSRTGNIVTFDQPPPLGSTVAVEIRWHE